MSCPDVLEVGTNILEKMLPSTSGYEMEAEHLFEIPVDVYQATLRHP
jgi:hypothetical protein